jgi:putative methionine-R-sulfoxide reductase with GAF domain
VETFRSKFAELLGAPVSREEKARLLALLIQSERGYHWVGLYDVSRTHISAIAWTGDEPPAFPTFPITKGINGAAVAQRAPVIVQDVSADSRYLTTFGATRSEAIFPVLSNDLARVVGTIDVESDRVNAFGDADETFLTECAILSRPLWRPP